MMKLQTVFSALLLSLSSFAYGGSAIGLLKDVIHPGVYQGQDSDGDCTLNVQANPLKIAIETRYETKEFKHDKRNYYKSIFWKPSDDDKMYSIMFDAAIGGDKFNSDGVIFKLEGGKTFADPASISKVEFYRLRYYPDTPDASDAERTGAPVRSGCNLKKSVQTLSLEEIQKRADKEH